MYSFGWIRWTWTFSDDEGAFLGSCDSCDCRKGSLWYQNRNFVKCDFKIKIYKEHRKQWNAKLFVFGFLRGERDDHSLLIVSKYLLLVFSGAFCVTLKGLYTLNLLRGGRQLWPMSFIQIVKQLPLDSGAVATFLWSEESNFSVWQLDGRV